MSRLVGPVPDPAERASSALRRSPRATLSLEPPGPADRPAAPRAAVAARPTGAPMAADSLVHQVPDAGDLWVAVPAAETAAIRYGGAHGRLEVLDVVVGGAADGRCRRVVVVEGRVELHGVRSAEHTSELQSRFDLVCRLL